MIAGHGSVDTSSPSIRETSTAKPPAAGHHLESVVAVSALVTSPARLLTTDQKVGGSSPFGRATDQGRDQQKCGLRP